MLRKIVVRLLVVLALFAPAVIAHAAGQPPLYQTEQQAQQHCPADIVVWLNLPSGIYHFRGQRWYGATKKGAYVCKKEADQASNRASRNGQ